MLSLSYIKYKITAWRELTLLTNSDDLNKSPYATHNTSDCQTGAGSTGLWSGQSGVPYEIMRLIVVTRVRGEVSKE